MYYVAKTKALISCVVTAQLIFVFAFAKSRFSHDAALSYLSYLAFHKQDTPDYKKVPDQG